MFGSPSVAEAGKIYPPYIVFVCISSAITREIKQHSKQTDATLLVPIDIKKLKRRMNLNKFHGVYFRGTATAPPSCHTPHWKCWLPSLFLSLSLLRLSFYFTHLKPCFALPWPVPFGICQPQLLLIYRHLAHVYFVPGRRCWRGWGSSQGEMGQHLLLFALDYKMSSTRKKEKVSNLFEWI